MKLRVQILDKPYASAPDDLAALLDPEIIVDWGEPDDGVGEYEVLVAGRPRKDHLERSSRLHSLVIPFAGIPAETRDLVLDHSPQLAVYNLHHNAIATAEMAFALLLAVAKQLIPADRALRSNDWRIRYKPNENMILSGRRVLILGYGAVGSNIARMCRLFGMEVHAIRRNDHADQEDEGVQLYPIDELDNLLPTAEVVFIALPLTPETENLLNAKRIAALPEHCLLVNVGRGRVVEEEALYEALKTGSIAGAGIDVWYQYPTREEDRGQTPPARLPFHNLDNVVMSPHRAGGSRENERLRQVHLAQVLNALAREETPASGVDLRTGY